MYSTYGFTLLSAVVERVSGQKFTDYMLKMFRDLDMLSTVLAASIKLLLVHT